MALKTSLIRLIRVLSMSKLVAIMAGSYRKRVEATCCGLRAVRSAAAGVVEGFEDRHRPCLNSTQACSSDIAVSEECPRTQSLPFVSRNRATPSAATCRERPTPQLAKGMMQHGGREGRRKGMPLRISRYAAVRIARELDGSTEMACVTAADAWPRLS